MNAMSEFKAEQAKRHKSYIDAIVATSANKSLSEYWADVKQKAALRKALTEVAERFSKIRTGMIYEAYVSDVRNMLDVVARHTGIAASAAATKQAFYDHCVNMLDIGELANSRAEIEREAAEARREAAKELYGDEY